MLRRMCLSHRTILSAVSACPPPPPHHHNYSTTTQEEENHTTTTTTNNNNNNSKTYDPATYCLPFDPAESKVIVETLNAATPQHLATFGVGKGVAGRLLRYRERIGEYRDLSQLLEVDGVGIRKAEGVCRCVLDRCGSAGVSGGVQDGGVLSSPPLQSEGCLPMEDLQALVGQKRLIKPRLSDAVIKNMESFVALHVTAGFLSWVLCGVDGQIHSLATHPLLSANTRFDALRIYEKVMSVTRDIPEADFYVWEDRASHTQLAKAPLGTVIVALQLAQIRGMLMVLLGGSMEVEEEEAEVQYGRCSRLLFLKDSVVPKLFRLKMGGDRLSGLGVADQVMDGRQAVDWLSPVTLEPEVHEEYFSEEAATRRYKAAAVLVAVAFREVVLSKNVAALRVLSQ